MKFNQEMYDHAKEQLRILRAYRRSHWEEMIDTPPALEDALHRLAVKYWLDAMGEQILLKLDEEPLPKE